MIKYVIGNLFDAPKGSYLAHACNCQGVWGSGIAKQFKEKFPKSFKQYKDNSFIAEPGDVFGCEEENSYNILCLFTSMNYGNKVDSPEQIIEATKKCFQLLPNDKPIHMPLINSGLFNVPWEKTAALLSQYDDLDITVYSLK